MPLGDMGSLIKTEMVKYGMKLVRASQPFHFFGLNKVPPINKLICSLPVGNIIYLESNIFHPHLFNGQKLYNLSSLVWHSMVTAEVLKPRGV